MTEIYNKLVLDSVCTSLANFRCFYYENTSNVFRPQKFKNATIAGQFGFMSKVNHMIIAPFSKCFPPTLKS